MKKIILFLLIPIFSISQNSWNMNLLGTYNYTAANGNDIWGWVDTSGNEYALVGLTTGFSVVNVSNPSSPIEEFFISDLNSTWRDIKTWGNYAYITTEANAGLLIVDLNDMSGNTYWHVNTFTNSNNDSIKFTSAHNIYIDENGVAYIFGTRNGGVPVANGGVIFLDVNLNPTNPVYLGQWNEEYIHDGMSRGDTLYAGCVYQGTLKIIDVTSKFNPITIGTQTTPDAFTHNAWVSDNGRFVFTTDEKSDAFIAAYDITDVNNIQEVDRIQSNPGSLSIPHNAHVDGNFLITSYYRDGTVVHDITYPSNMIEVAFYDSYSGAGNGFDGCWGTYPFLPSGNIISSDRNSNNGQGQLLVYGRDFQQACYLQGNITDCISSLPISTGSIRIFDVSNNLILTDNTNLLGDFQTAVVNPGVYQVMISAAGYITDTFNVSLSSGIMTILDTVLCSQGTIYGCTDSLALNYDSLAVIDDSSCIYCSQNGLIFSVGGGTADSEISWGLTQWNGWAAASGVAGVSYGCVQDRCYIFRMYDSAGDGWNGATYTITDSSGVILATGTLLNGNFGSDTIQIGTSVPCPIYGCTDPLACNYDSSATVDDSSCVYPVIWQQAFSICDGDSVVVGSSVYYTTGNYTDTLNASNGCDSIMYTNIYGVNQHTSSYDTITSNNVILWNTMYLGTSGDYSDTLINSAGCDSIAYLNLTIINTTGVIDLTNKKELLKIIDFLGRETRKKKNQPLFYIYDDGTVEKRIIIE
ncbi:MAG: choice-of-anchor B family protein [Bacteroidota bacterium]|nr:choice-of-anchor B family protein [Bacteroidota bacterium]